MGHKRCGAPDQCGGNVSISFMPGCPHVLGAVLTKLRGNVIASFCRGGNRRSRSHTRLTPSPVAQRGGAKGTRRWPPSRQGKLRSEGTLVGRPSARPRLKRALHPRGTHRHMFPGPPLCARTQPGHSTLSRLRVPDGLLPPRLHPHASPGSLKHRRLCLRGTWVQE